jgi:hypothetical protein
MTDEDYTKVMRKYPGFTLAVQSLFMRYSVLFVGYGSTDPHLEVLLKELSYYFRYTNSQTLPRYFLIRNSDEVDLIFEKHKKLFRTEIIKSNNFLEQLDLLKKLQKKFPRKK